MFRQKKIDIPIYFGTLILVESDNIKKLEKKFEIKDIKPFDALTFPWVSKKGRTKYYMLFTQSGKTNKVIAHECLHTVNQIFKDRGIILDPDNDEPQCYLLGWLVEQCEEFLKPKK